MQNYKELTSREYEYLLRARAKYKRLLSKCSFKLSLLDKIAYAIRIVENINRPALWRCLEYIFMFFTIPKFIISKKLTNLSIGIFQLKITIILEYLNYDYELERKTIAVRNPSLLMIRDIYNNRNNLAILEEFFKRHNITSSNTETKIDTKAFRSALMEYSRNVEFTGSLNYYKLCYFLVFGKISAK